MTKPIFTAGYIAVKAWSRALDRQYPPSVAVVPERTSSAAVAGLSAVAAAAALWAVGAVVARRLFDAGVNPVELTESRAVLACAGFALVPVARRRPQRGRRGDIVGLGVALALVNVTYYVAISRIPVAVALVVQYTAPAFVVAWTSAVSRRAPSPQVLAALVVALVGVVLVVDLVSGAGGRMDALGVAVAVASALFFATYTVLAERTGAVYGSAGAMFRGFTVATVLWVAYQAPRGFPRELVEPSNLPEVFYLGLAGTLVPFFLYAWGVARVRAERAAIAATLEPVIAAVVAWAWLGQHLSAVQVAGGVLVVGAVVSLQLRRTRPLVAPDK
jgi:DME family drug/metabolite transporter